MIQAPCYQCKDRKVSCHSECSRYKEFKNKVDAERTMTINSKISDEAYTAYKINKNIRRKYKVY